MEGIVEKCHKCHHVTAFNDWQKIMIFFIMHIVYHIIDKPIKGILWFTLRMHSFEVIWIRISDPRSLRSWYIKKTDESTLVMDSSAPFV